ncbi:unannotated protein [freshwater metagenome]|uniref:Unannotated protein n=1 Tax=freshwater metagenome TaxID=449393 RepID=A0A6J7GNR0_9ZZZZ
MLSLLFNAVEFLPVPPLTSIGASVRVSTKSSPLESFLLSAITVTAIFIFSPSKLLNSSVRIERNLVSKTSFVKRSGADKSRLEPSSDSPASKPSGLVRDKNAAYWGVETEVSTCSHNFCRSTCANVAIYPPHPGQNLKKVTHKVIHRLWSKPVL